MRNNIQRVGGMDDRSKSSVQRHCPEKGPWLLFPQGADAYIDELVSVIPIADGSSRTALNTSCGLGSLHLKLGKFTKSEYRWLLFTCMHQFHYTTIWGRRQQKFGN
ncbi:hypothetical protein PIB30_004491 [Stylosanthes scabra]|uniref:Uncharacterized protein n=1 Tax=Stylosanthes scabra TaxID=79078 RepID=A0ABU6X3P9_9FABA|nr:hypothetical protein [Stylosanthes scabra]